VEEEMKAKVIRGTLLLAGLPAIVIGAMLLFAPAMMHAANGVTLGARSSLLSEIRAPGGALAALGALIVLGALSSRLTFTAAVVGACTYLAYGASRLVSVVLDGAPSSSLVAATIAELVLGLVCASVLVSLERTARSLVAARAEAR
jgi:hypothetical protein